MTALPNRIAPIQRPSGRWEWVWYAVRPDGSMTSGSAPTEAEALRAVSKEESRG